MYKKMAATGLVLALSVGLAAGGFATRSQASAGAGAPGTGGVTIKDQEIMFDMPRLLEEIHYPQVRGLNDKSVQDRINAVFQDAGIRAEDEGYDNEVDLPPGFGYAISWSNASPVRDPACRNGRRGMLCRRRCGAPGRVGNICLREKGFPPPE
ncbi:MAG TPA: hypothetical protein VMW83_15385 [Spirochaetia bacterium]|nr:hypothetical protein [Spirochaetia bacterium]